jgi:glycosyltransferase involved in cell wall biosynthesis
MISKKIIIDFERLKYPNTGLYSYSKSLGESMNLLSESDLTLNYYLPKSFKNHFSTRINVIENHFWHKYIPSNYHEDVWHVTHQGSQYFSGNKKSKKILTIHDLNFLIEKKGNDEKILKYKKHIEKHIKQANVITCISNYVKQDVLNNFDIEGKPIEVIYNGCEILKLTNFKKPNFFVSKPFLFHIGTFLPKKNIHTLLPLIIENEYELILAGNFSDKRYVSQIKQIAIDLDISDRVHLLDGISEQDKHWYYQNCNAFVFPSIAEGFGLPVVEAMQYGKAIFLSKHTSLPEIGGDVAYYFDNFTPEIMKKNLLDGLNHYNNKADKKDIINRSKKFSWEQSAREYLDIYKSI